MTESKAQWAVQTAYGTVGPFADAMAAGMYIERNWVYLANPQLVRLAPPKDLNDAHEFSGK